MRTDLLEELACILDKADALHAEKGEPAYKQAAYAHASGTPACALGHWAAAHPERGWRIACTPRLATYGEARLTGPFSGDACYDACLEFQITRVERNTFQASISIARRVCLHRY